MPKLYTCESKITICEGIFGEINGVDDEKSKSSWPVSEESELFNAEEYKVKSESSTQVILGTGDCRCSDDEKPVRQLIKIKYFNISNENGMSVKIITLGATIVSLKTADKYGDQADIVLGYDNIKNYLDPSTNHFIGCVLGRCANRIKDGTFKIKNDEFNLTKNDWCKHHLHGGTNSFGRQVWDSYIDHNDCTLVLTYLSNDGEEGYPGAVLVTIRFKLTQENRLIINMEATTSKTTVVNLSHGSLFNLAGHDAGEEELKSHRVSLNCDRWTFAEYSEPIPTGAIRSVGGTVMDLRVPRLLRDIIDNVPPGEGFDHNFCVIKGFNQEISYVARVLHSKSGRFLEVYSNMPGVNFYTGGRLPPCPSTDVECEKKQEIGLRKSENKLFSDPIFECDSPCPCVTPEWSCTTLSKIIEFLPGKNGAKYKKFGAFSVQPQGYPNAINVDNFPCTILRPGETYNHDIVYKFGVQLGGYI